MHPIERLRAIARSSGVDQELLVQETASALSAFGDDPAGMVTACRRILYRNLASGPLWWLCSRVLTADDAMAEAWAAARELEADRSSAELAFALPEGAVVCVLGWPEQVAEGLTRRGDLDVLVVDVRGEGSSLVRALDRAAVEATDVAEHGLGAAVAAADVLVLEASMVGPDAALAVSGSLAAAAVAAQTDTPVWLLAGVGRMVPGRVWEAVTAGLDQASDPWDAEVDAVPTRLVNRVGGPAGPESVAEAVARTDCPVAPELLRL